MAETITSLFVPATMLWQNWIVKCFYHFSKERERQNNNNELASHTIYFPSSSLSHVLPLAIIIVFFSCTAAMCVACPPGAIFFSIFFLCGHFPLLLFSHSVSINSTTWFLSSPSFSIVLSWAIRKENSANGSPLLVFLVWINIQIAAAPPENFFLPKNIFYCHSDKFLFWWAFHRQNQMLIMNSTFIVVFTKKIPPKYYAYILFLSAMTTKYIYVDDVDVSSKIAIYPAKKGKCPFNCNFFLLSA